MTPEERSVIEAALTWTEQVFMNHSPTNYDRLKEACDAIRKSRELKSGAPWIVSSGPYITGPKVTLSVSGDDMNEAQRIADILNAADRT